jgi:hypothetical protein
MDSQPGEPQNIPSHRSASVMATGVVAVIIFAITLLLSLFILELTGRVYIARRSLSMPVDFKSLHGDLMHQYDPDLGWALRPDISLLMPYKVSTNSLGLRNQELRKEEGHMRILALGDSRTFGDGVNDEETWAYQLEQRLNEHQPGRFEVINAGVCGWNALQGLWYLQKQGLQFKPHLVICAFGVNEWALVEPGDMGWIEWEDLQGRWGVEALVRGAIKGAANMIDNRPFGSRAYRVSPGEYVDAIVRMQELCQGEGITFAILYLPGQHEIGKIGEMAGYLRVKWLNQGIARYGSSFHWDPTERFSLPADGYYVDPFHFSVTGNAFIAEYLCEEILSQ